MTLRPKARLILMMSYDALSPDGCPQRNGERALLPVWLSRVNARH